MKKCPRCDHWHHSVASNICDQCWEDMGQMQFWSDEDKGMADPLLWDGTVVIDNDDEYLPPVDTVFDREEEARGYQ